MSRTAAPLVLMYHSVTEFDSDPFGITVSPRRFEQQLRWIRDRGLRGVSMAELDPTGPSPGLVGLTFDDGYVDFLEVAVPRLTAFGFTATVYVVAGKLGGTNDWDSGGPVKPLMDTEQVRRTAAAGMEIGSHAFQHRSMPTLDDGELQEAVQRSRDELTALAGRPVTSFAYPYGHAGEREFAAVREAGYQSAVLASPHGDSAVSMPRTYAGESDGRLRLDLKRVRHWRDHVRPYRASSAR